jgi:arylsulfatase A-like enzyme
MCIRDRLDIYPTLVELCGLPPREGLEGRSLVPQLKDAKAPRSFPAVTTHGPGNHAVRTERWRYIRYADGAEELYDLQKDPNEWTNLAGDPAQSQRKRELARWLPETSRDPLPGSKSRLIEIRDGRAYWETELIDPASQPEQ